jgi:DNA-binding transcriptional LysR family regulator
MLELRRLHVLHQLAQHGTVTAAAEAMHLTGPAVSQHLAALEREAGAKLVEKHGRTLALTPAGRLLVSHAEVVLNDIAAAESALAALTTQGAGVVRIAAFPSAARVLVPPAWAALAGGTVTLRLLEQEPELSVESLRRRDVDMAIVHGYTLLPRQVPTHCDEHHLLDDPVLLAVPPSVAAERGLAAGDVASLADFAGLPWLAPNEDVSCHEITARACGAAGFVPDTVAHATDFAVLTALVAAGVGVALVPALALPADVCGVSLHPLAEPVTRKVFALTRAGSATRPDLRLVLAQLRVAADAWST